MMRDVVGEKKASGAEEIFDFKDVILGPATIGPGETFRLTKRAPAGCRVTKLAPATERADDARHFVFQYLRVAGRDQIASRSPLPAGTLEETAFERDFAHEGDGVVLGVTNVSDEGRAFAAVVRFERKKSLADSVLDEMQDEARREVPNDLPEEETGFFGRLVGKCVKWFEEGVVAGFMDAEKGAKGESLETLVYEGPLRVRDSVRGFVANALGCLEIPFIAARHYWEGLLPGARDERAVRTAVYPLEARNVPGGATATIEIDDVPYEHKMVELAVDPNVALNFEITDVRAGKNCQLASGRSIPARAFVPSAPMETEPVKPHGARKIAISVRCYNNVQPHDFRGYAVLLLID